MLTSTPVQHTCPVRVVGATKVKMDPIFNPSENELKERWAELMKYVKTHSDDWEELEETQSLESPFRFEPRKTRRFFKKMAAAQPGSAEDVSRTVFQMQLLDNCHPEQDAAFFIYVFFKYGNIQKVLKEAGDAAAFISKKCALYGISTKTHYPSKGHYRDITLSRIARAFPLQAAKVILKEKFQGILTFSSFFQQDLPLIMQHAIFSSLTRIRHFDREMLDIATILNMEIYVKLAKPEEKSKLMTRTVEDAIKYSKSYVYKTSTLDDEDEKLEILTKAGVFDVNAKGEFELSAQTAALVNRLPIIQAVYSFKYSEAVEKLKSNR